MKYAVEQINNCSSLLPGVQLDFLFNDTKVDRTTFHILPTKSGHFDIFFLVAKSQLKFFLRATSGVATPS